MPQFRRRRGHFLGLSAEFANAAYFSDDAETYAYYSDDALTLKYIAQD